MLCRKPIFRKRNCEILTDRLEFDRFFVTLADCGDSYQTASIYTLFKSSKNPNSHISFIHGYIINHDAHVNLRLLTWSRIPVSHISPTYPIRDACFGPFRQDFVALLNRDSSPNVITDLIHRLNVFASAASL